MTIEETCFCNRLSLEVLAKFFAVPAKDFLLIYDELQSDQEFLNDINERIELGFQKYNYQAGLFRKGKLDRFDWFGGQRIFLYVIVRYFCPPIAVETGVLYGGNSAFILRALDRNQTGKLISIDYPVETLSPEEKQKRHHLVGDSEILPEGFHPGFIIPDNRKSRWDLRLGDSLSVIPSLNEKIDFFCHDSEHSFDFMSKELTLAFDLAKNDAIFMADDVDWSNGFFKFCIDRCLLPLVLPDNGKDGLRMRTGVTWLANPNNAEHAFTGK